jgi:hypothetical protein
MLPQVLATLAAAARELGLTDAAWARRAGLRKESLSRLRRRQDCDWATLAALATAVEYRLDAVPGNTGRSPDGHFPAPYTREYEDSLLRLALSGDRSATTWLAHGPPFFMAGFAMILAGLREYDRLELTGLADQLHPGMTEPTVLDLWLKRSPLRPARFIPLLEAARRHASRR